MNHLVLAVSTESSTKLLGEYADVVLLDKDPLADKVGFYDTLYIRSHFADETTLPQNFQTEIERMVQQAKENNPNLKIVDGMDTVDEIIGFEDKWHQYTLYGSYMPHTELMNEGIDESRFQKPVYKNRLSSNGSGVTWIREKAIASPGNWIVQESLQIREELRVYVLYGEVFPIGAVRESMTEDSKAHGVKARPLTQDEIDFSQQVMQQTPHLEIIGLDIARVASGELMLIEVNRSPGFAKFYELTGTNLASRIYEKI